MPTYCYICPQCGRSFEVRRKAGRGPSKRPPSSPCHGKQGQRDYALEGFWHRKAEIADFISHNGGVLPLDIDRANRHPPYIRMGVEFDRRGDAHVPGRSMMAFYKERGMSPR